MPGCKLAMSDGRTVARKLIRVSRARGEYFDADLLGDPVWELLLRLYDAEESRRVYPTQDLRQEFRMSPETLRRWIKVLERRGLITVIAETELRDDGLIKLTRSAHGAMGNYLMAISQHDTVPT
jgi:DNA-binding MarR family transcriptional regulator